MLFQCIVRGGSEEVQEDCCWRSASWSVPSVEPRPKQPLQLGPGEWWDAIVMLWNNEWMRNALILCPWIIQHSTFLCSFQDLPNNMIHQVAIKSLPQEWLWCETWCDDVSKKTAKTIDLVSGSMNTTIPYNNAIGPSALCLLVVMCPYNGHWLLTTVVRCHCLSKQHTTWLWPQLRFLSLLLERPVACSWIHFGAVYHLTQMKTKINVFSMPSSPWEHLWM